MIASTPVRLLSLAVVAVVVIVGLCGIGGGFAFGGNMLDTIPGPHSVAAAGERTPGVVAYVLDGDTVQVITGDSRDVRVRVLGISAPEIPHPGKPGECYGSRSTGHLKQLLPAGTQVMLVSDPTQDDVDTYWRWLRYVHASGRDIGAAQIRSGSAARDSSAPVSRHAAYVTVEDQPAIAEQGCGRHVADQRAGTNAGEGVYRRGSGGVAPLGPPVVRPLQHSTKARAEACPLTRW